MVQQRKTQTIPRAPVGRILQKSGAKRVSQDATEAFADIIEEIATEIATKANQIAKHSGRKTVLDKDVKLAAK